MHGARRHDGKAHAVSAGERKEEQAQETRAEKTDERCKKAESKRQERDSEMFQLFFTSTLDFSLFCLPLFSSPFSPLFALSLSIPFSLFVSLSICVSLFLARIMNACHKRTSSQHLPFPVYSLPTLFIYELLSSLLTLSDYKLRPPSCSPSLRLLCSDS